MTRLLLIILILFAYILYAAFKHKATWRQLTVLQLVGVLLTFIAVTGSGAIILYYGVRSLVALIDNGFIRIIIQFVTAIIVVIVGTVVFNKAVHKITNGILPMERKRK
ncbi:hypothetical protein [Lentibacillus cibarius]|uniref:Uncharacterized protein n=1 Tax=Lentibacillus cibarius TaxID=2583219 RepID=A0A5S3QNN2_9BACI|nr:hypothetical protein [Lentibacillus cibarius]TMN23399.1 hypothetical protein FFL34_15825 [Lentibacillus cibarius]